MLHLDYSPVKGPEGNIEYLVHLANDNLPESEETADVAAVVRMAHEALDKIE